MSAAAAARGRARLDAFRARRAGAGMAPREDAIDVSESAGLKVTHEDTLARDATHASLATSGGAASRDGTIRVQAMLAHARAKMHADVVTEEKSSDGARDAAAFEATPRLIGACDDVREVANATASEKAMEVRNAYADLADTYAETVVSTSDAAPREDARGAKEGVLGVTTSTDRAREQYERVMRAIGGGSEINASLFDDPERASDGTNNATDEVETPAPEEFPELDAIIEQVRVSGVISDASTRVVRDDQSEIAMLQEVIDDMTTEKLALVRGLQKSQAMVNELANENDVLMQRYNETKSQLSHTREELDRLWLQYQERSAIGADKDVLMMGNPDASQRVQSLAAEVVALEERLQDVDRIKDENERLHVEAKRSKSHASELELVLEATREQDRLFKERMRTSSFMKTLEKLEEDEAVFLCAWLKKDTADVERETRIKVSSMEEQRERDETSAETDEQIVLISSIHELLEQLEIEKKTLAQQLNSANEVKQQLSERNTLLESQLAKVLNRLADGGNVANDDWSSDEDEKPRRGGLFSLFRRRRE